MMKDGKELQASTIVLRKILLICGILATLLYVAMNVFIPMRWEGYSCASQTVSELSAVDAPTRPLWFVPGVIYTLLMAAFGFGVWQSAARNRPLRIAGILFIINGIIGLFWPPMHQRDVLAAGGGTLTDTMHIIFSFVTVFLFLLEMGFGAAAFGKRFRMYSFATILIALAFGVLTGLDSPGISANSPTPWIGVWERINIGVYLVWVVVLTVILLRAEKRQYEPRSKMAKESETKERRKTVAV
jgi:hypothetical protein